MPLEVERNPVLIVGAGPTGLVLALWLTRLGVPIRIIDRAERPGTTSRALAVQARTLEFYRQIGIADDAIAGGVKVPALNLWVSGRPRARVPIDAIGEGLSPFAFALVYPQDAHERMLIDHLERAGIRVERETELVRLEQRRRRSERDAPNENRRGTRSRRRTSPAATARHRPSDTSSASNSPAAPIRDTSMSPTFRRAAPSSTTSCTSTSRTRISSSSSR